MLGRGDLLSSFMGHGVVRAASLSLSLLLRGVASAGLPQVRNELKYSCRNVERNLFFFTELVQPQLEI